ncbi:hypothetical protein GW17_00038447 [Ensete ventricosum]|nr:hypothetical protein GW17_00038447 [Ensete ventricosum]
MSATADITRYRDYFKDLGRDERVEVIAIPNAPQHYIFQRKVLYLDQGLVVDPGPSLPIHSSTPFGSSKSLGSMLHASSPSLTRTSLCRSTIGEFLPPLVFLLVASSLSETPRSSSHQQQFLLLAFATCLLNLPLLEMSLPASLSNSIPSTRSSTHNHSCYKQGNTAGRGRKRPLPHPQGEHSNSAITDPAKL